MSSSPAPSTGAKLTVPIPVPAIVLVGEDDTPFRNSSEYMVAKIPAAVGPVVLPHASHWANYDQPELWNTAVREFLASLDN